MLQLKSNKSKKTEEVNDTNYGQQDSMRFQDSQHSLDSYKQPLTKQFNANSMKVLTANPNNKRRQMLLGLFNPQKK